MSKRLVLKGGRQHARTTVEALEERRLLATGLMISEFMASNTAGYQDLAFPADYPDWIELHNPTGAAVNLAGWKLKDSGTTPWAFPAGASIPAGGFLVVAADGKNLLDPAKVLHTNFSLNKDGEYLGLIRPDGTVAQEFAPFPAQVNDVSYGVLAEPTARQTFIGPTSPLTAVVPTGGTPATAWRDWAFDDSSWLTGSGGVGFDADGTTPPSPAGWNVRMVRATSGDYSNIAVAKRVLDGDLSGFTVVENSQTPVANLDFMVGGHFALANPLPNGVTASTVDNNPLREQYAIRATASVTIPAGTYTVGVNSDDGFQLSIPGVTFTGRYGENNQGLASAAHQITYGAPRGSGDTLGTFTLASPLTTTVTVDFYERTGGDTFEVFVSPSAKTAYDSSFRLLADGAAGWSVRTTAADPTYVGQYGLDLQAAMRNVNASAYVRIPFSVLEEDLSSFETLLLRMKFDDGFVAYVNGQRVAGVNDPANLDFQSTATAPNPDVRAVQFTDFVIPNAQAYLRAGQNVLAIQALNASASDSDFLNVATLEGQAATQDVNRFFGPATPGTVNTGGFVAQVKDTKFDHDRGFYDAPFQLKISTSTDGATIRYTTDGSTPSATNGIVYTGPITIDRTTTLRAISLKPGYLPTNVDTQTYIFLDDVITQSASNSNNGAPPPGWPANWGPNRTDYGMDPDVVNASPYSATIKNDLKTIPSLSIVTDLSNLFGPSGIYSNPGNDGRAWERRASLELINPDGSTGFQTDFGLRIRGGFSRSTDNAKHSFRVLLRPEYGNGALDFPLFASQDGVDQPKSFDIRTFQNYSWSFSPSGGPGFDVPDTGAGSRFIGLRDQFSRDTQYDMGHNAERGDFYHLYINGQYWGVYNTAERPEAEYASTYYGGTPEDYDVVKANGGSITATDGNLTAWQAFYNLANQLRATADAGQSTAALYQRMLGNNPDGTRNPAYPVYLDAENLIDYMLAVYYTGNMDAPLVAWNNTSPNNYLAVWNHTTKDMGFQFFAHDGEHNLLDANANFADRLGPWEAGTTSFSRSNPQGVFQQLLFDPEFRTLVGDRIHKFFFNGGALTTEKNTARFVKRVEELNRAIVGESARWGDARTSGAPYTYQTWQNNINAMLNFFFPVRNAVVMGQFRTQPMGNVGGANFFLYSSTEAPEFAGQFGGAVATGTVLQLTNPNAGGAGTIYYTTDGSDPRLPGGALSPKAIAFNPATGITVTGTVRVRARALIGSTWSAITDAVFVNSAPPAVRVTELMYHPQGPPDGSPYGAEDFEYLVLHNATAQTVNLKGFALTKGVSFTFAGDTMLVGGGRVVLVRNLAAFRSRYGDAIPVAGTYTGQLDNGGERVRLSGPLGETIQSFEYGDDWYPQTDGEGFSLVVRNVGQAPSLWDNRSGWAASPNVNGSPGSVPAGATLAPGAVVINEVAANVATPNTTWVELRNTTNNPIDLSYWFLSNDAGNVKKYQFPFGTVLPANGYLVLNEQTSYGQAGNPAALATFTFDGAGRDTIVLSQADSAGTLHGYREIQDYDASDAGRTLGRLTQSDGGVDFVAQTSATPGAANAGAVVGPIVINEIMYAPAARYGVGNYANPSMEYVELRNVSGQAVNLFDPANPTNTWRLSGGIDFTFPQGVTIPAGGYVVLTNLRPADFRTLYGASIPAGALILGPYSGFLDNSGEKITLERPGIPIPPAAPGGAVVVPYITVDKVAYDNDGAWPSSPNGGGPSLRRVSSTAYGNDPANWAASQVPGGTPGRDNAPASPPVVTLPATGSVNEGSTFTVGGSFTAPIPGRTYSLQVQWGDGTSQIVTPNADRTFTVSHLYADSGAYAVWVTAFDNVDSYGSAALALTVNNVAPTSATFGIVGGATTISEGSTPNFSISGRSDPSTVDAARWLYSFDWDNDGVYDVVDSPANTATIPAAYTADGPRVLRVRGRIKDKDGGFTEYFRDVSVVNVAPGGTPISDQTLAGPGTLNVAGTFTDPGADTWVGTVDWDYTGAGDTDAVPLAIGSNRSFTLNHAYAPGVYVVRYTITDDDGGQQIAQFNVTVGGDTAPPAVADAQFLYLTGPRRVSVRFSEDVSRSLQAADLTVRNLNAAADLPADAATLSWDPATFTATWTFASLADANYRATLHAAGVTDRSLNAVAQDATLDFFHLAGDANHDRTVGFADLLALAKNYGKSGKTYADGDFDGDGQVGFPDLLALARNYNKSLAAPPASGAMPAGPVTTGTGAMPSLADAQASLEDPAPTPAPAPRPAAQPVKVPLPLPVPVPVPVPATATASARPATAAPVFSVRKIAPAARRLDDVLA